MRPIVPALLLAAALTGCSTIREGLGEYQRAADKGIGHNLGGRPDEPVTASTSEKRPQLPAGLGGDKAHAEYTGTPQN